MKKKIVSLTIEEIERYWGSVAAYNEEQRRCGLFELETQALDLMSFETSRATADKSRASFGRRLFGAR